jgi:hypothetical protein
MTPLQRASVPPEEIDTLVASMIAQWRAGHTMMRQWFPQPTEEEAQFAMHAKCSESVDMAEIWKNETYQVMVHPMNGKIADDWVHLSIKRNDREVIHDWRDIQEIKNQLLGRECEAVELYPAESRVIDASNQFHLWGRKNTAFRFPFGFDEGRHVSNDTFGKSKQRPRT